MREPKTVQLTVQERLGAAALLPAKANFANMKLIRELREALSLSSEEMDGIEFKEAAQGDGRTQLTWNEEKAAEVVADIPFDPKMYVVVMEALQKLDESEELEQTQVSLYEKFVQVKTGDDKIAGKVE